MKPYQVWIKQDNVAFRCVMSSDNPSECFRYVSEKISHGNNVERIEVRDLDGSIETIFDRSWRLLTWNDMRKVVLSGALAASKAGQ
jgi:hypothetical protein